MCVELCNPGLNLAAIRQTRGIVPPGEARQERLESLQTFVVQAAQFEHGFFMIIDAQVQLQVVFVALNAQRSRLFAAFVATGIFASGHGRQQAFGQG